MKPDEFCSIIGQQRTGFGERDGELHPEHTRFIHQTYYYTYNTSTQKERRRVRNCLQIIRHLSSYVWILVATSFTFTTLTRLSDLDEYLKVIRSWMEAYPISASEKDKACDILQPLDYKREKTVNEGEKIGKRVAQRKVPKKNLFPMKQENAGVLSHTTIPTMNSMNEKVQEKWKFLISIDALSRPDEPNETSITRVTCDQELNNVLKQPFQTPILWRNYSQQYPFQGIPSSIPEFIEELRQLNIESLETHDYTSENTNYFLYLDEILNHFKAPSETSDPLNFLDIRNHIISNVPVHVNKANLYRLALRRQEGSAQKTRPLKVPFDYADHEFFLVSSRHSISTLHSDTGGKMTYIVGISGCKTWYLPRKFNTETYEILATFGSSTPETYGDGWVKVDIMPGDLLIMPPGCPHAVFTPEHSLTFGGHFYTLPHLGSSLRILAIQAKFNDVFSNESLTEQDYLALIVMLEAYKDLINYQQMASIASSGIGWGITDQHRTREQVSRIRWDRQEFQELQQRLRLQIFDIEAEGFRKFE